MDLLSLVLTLRPTRPAALPPRLGRAAYAILLSRLSAADPALAAALHAGDGPKPVTCSDLIGPREAGLVSPAATYTLRYTALTAPVAAALSRAFALGDTLTFEGVDLEVVEIDPPGSPWPGTDGYDTLAARYLLPSGPLPAGSWTLLLTSPTAFKSQGLTQALPLPSLVFGSLAARWNAFAPVALPEEDVRRYAQERVAISRFALRSMPGWDRGQGDRRGMRIGAIGKVTYSALNRDRYWPAVLGLLVAFARYAGLGMLTTMGMGQVRQLENAPPGPQIGQKTDGSGDADGGPGFAERVKRGTMTATQGHVGGQNGPVLRGASQSKMSGCDINRTIEHPGMHGLGVRKTGNGARVG